MFGAYILMIVFICLSISPLIFVPLSFYLEAKSLLKNEVIFGEKKRNYILILIIMWLVRGALAFLIRDFIGQGIMRIASSVVISNVIIVFFSVILSVIFGAFMAKAINFKLKYWGWIKKLLSGGLIWFFINLGWFVVGEFFFQGLH